MSDSIESAGFQFVKMKVWTDMKRFVFLATITMLPSTPVFAHVGHLGEVAGHTHWIAVGAVVAAGAIAAAAGILKAKEKAAEQEEQDDDTVEADGETA